MEQVWQRRWKEVDVRHLGGSIDAYALIRCGERGEGGGGGVTGDSRVPGLQH